MIKKIIASETQEQQALIEIAQTNPITKNYLFKITNEGKRHIATAKKFKREGLKAGVSDVFLSYPSKGYHGLYIELKRRDKNAKLTKEQADWIEKVRAVGYAANAAWGWQEAWQQIQDYLN